MLNAAEAIQADAGIGDPVETSRRLSTPRWLTVLGRVVLNSCAALAKLWMLFTESDYDPRASDVPPFDPELLPGWPIQIVDGSLSAIGGRQAPQAP